MERDIRPYYRKRWAQRKSLSNGSVQPLPVESKRQDARDEDILKVMWQMIACGLSIFLGGFVLWSLDNHYCTQLRSWRHEVDLPYGILLEGHGWWHLMTGIGAYFYIVWGIWLRHCLNGRQDEFQLVWPSMLASLPRVERVRHEHMNGAVKKQS